MKRFQEFFPELKNTRNHTIIILEEVFNRYYDLLPTEEERSKLIHDFSKLIRESRVERSLNVAVPISIETNKMYFIEDYFLQNYNQEIKNLMDEIDRSGFSFDEMEIDDLFRNDSEIEMIDNTPIEKESLFYNAGDSDSNSSSRRLVDDQVEDDVNLADAFFDSSEKETRDKPASTNVGFSLFSQEMQHVEESYIASKQESVLNDGSSLAEESYLYTTESQENLKSEESEEPKKEPQPVEIETGDGVIVFEKTLNDIFYNETILELTESLKQINGDIE